MKLTSLATGLLIALPALLHVSALASYSQTRVKLVQTNSIVHSIDDEASQSKDRLSPIILLPGDGGSKLEAKLNRKAVSHKYCGRKTNDWFILWLNLSLLVPFAVECWVENMKLVYDPTTRTTQNSPGVEIRVGEFGRSESVEYVDPARVHGTDYFDSLVKYLVTLGYERNQNILGAPYDFRRAPNELQDYFASLKNLVEVAYEKNGQERVVFMCHSMGCLNGLYFLQSKDQAWKDKYIRSMISLSGVWGGSVKALKAFASGDNFGIAVIPTLSLRKDVRTFPSLAYLMPSKDVFPNDTILVKNRDKRYTVNDYKQFFDDMDYPTGYEMWRDVHNLTLPLVAPGVEVHCLYGNRVSTMESLDYEAGHFPESRPIIKYGDGDGTVNLRSLKACLRWSKQQKQPFYHKNFTNIDHMTILSDSQVLDYIGEALSKRQV